MKFIEGRNVYTVSEINSITRKTLEQINFWVEGELSSFQGFNPRYRYLYFDIKDPDTGFKLPCILDPHIYNEQNYQFEDGSKVLAMGNMTIWEKEAKLQMNIIKLEDFGEGFLLAKLEKLKKKLQAKGYFDTRSKRGIPQYPTNVAVISSQVSDAWHDFKRHAVDKYGVINFTLYDVLVQGSRSVKLLNSALKKALKGSFDVIVIIRGGGSTEDLASFNDELLASNIYKAKTPIIVGVGHEKDVTIASMVADIAASTPTDAAKILTNGFSQLEEKLAVNKSYLINFTKNQVISNSQHLDYLYQKLLYNKSKYLTLPKTLDFYGKALISSTRTIYTNRNQKLLQLQKSMYLYWANLIKINSKELQNIKHKLNLVSPKNILKRGYSITTTNEGLIVTNIDIVGIGQNVKVKLARGNLNTKILQKEN